MDKCMIPNNMVRTLHICYQKKHAMALLWILKKITRLLMGVDTCILFLPAHINAFTGPSLRDMLWVQNRDFPSLTWVDHRGNFSFGTWRSTQNNHRTIPSMGFSPCAIKCVPCDLETSTAKVCIFWRIHGNTTVELMAQNIGIYQVPVGVTKSSLHLQNLDLHYLYTLGVSIHQTKVCVPWREDKALNKWVLLSNLGFKYHVGAG